MKKLLLVLLALPLIGFGQNVNIPDVNFKAYLLGNSLINTNGDTEIQVSEAAAFTGTIYCQSMGISNLTGIEAFTALTWLECSYNQLTSLNVSQNTALGLLSCSFNQLTSLDVSQNTALTYLWCESNQLTSLNLSQNTALTSLYCYSNQLDSLNVSQNTALTSLYCDSNQLTSLDVSQNTALTQLRCYNNQLTSLNISQNTALTYLECDGNQLTSLDVRNGNNTNFNDFYATNNPNLYCIDVDDDAFSTFNWTGSNFGFDSQSYFSNNCSGTTEVEEQTTNKELLKITDLLGRETKATNQLLFYIYNDGTVEKKVVIN
jgi:Leucine-rich repeat (LRR) protein